MVIVVDRGNIYRIIKYVCIYYSNIYFSSFFCCYCWWSSLRNESIATTITNSSQILNIQNDIERRRSTTSLMMMIIMMVGKHDIYIGIKLIICVFFVKWLFKNNSYWLCKFVQFKANYKTRAKKKKIRKKSPNMIYRLTIDFTFWLQVFYYYFYINVLII